MNNNYFASHKFTLQFLFFYRIFVLSLLKISHAKNRKATMQPDVKACVS